MTITLQSIVKRSTDQLEAELDDETMMMNVEKGTYYGVKKTSKPIWELLEEPVPVSGLVDVLVAEYAVDRQTCEREVLNILSELHEEGLVAVGDQ